MGLNTAFIGGLLVVVLILAIMILILGVIAVKATLRVEKAEERADKAERELKMNTLLWHDPHPSTHP